MTGPDVFRGAVAGFLATVPMTLAMEGMHVLLPWWERHPLPPRQITEAMEEAVALRGPMEEPEHVALTLVNHFAYGAGAGAAYVPFARAVPAPPALKGALFGLGVWTVSYLALMPALDVLNPATEHPMRRNALMIAAHLVWGSTTGILFDHLRHRTRDEAHARLDVEGPDAEKNWPTTSTSESGEALPHAVHAL